MMSDNEIRIAIAEACGLSTKLEQFGGVMAYRGKDGHFVATLPNYCKDLNAMHEAEKVLKPNFLPEENQHIDDSEWEMYICELSKISNSGPTHATAHQRAEAFLKTIGKWA